MTRAGLGAPRCSSITAQVIVQNLIAEEQTHHDQETQGGEIDGAHGESALEIGGDGDDHLTEGEDHVQHGPLRQMSEVHQLCFGAAPQRPRGHDAVQDRHPGQGHARPVVDGDGRQYDGRLSEQGHHHAPDGPLLIRLATVAAQLDGILHADVDQDQGPGQVILVLGALPVQPGSLPDVIQQIHVHEQGDVIPHAVSAVHIGVEG